MNIADILQFKFPNVNFYRQVVVRDEGKGQFIYKWDYSLGPFPSQEDLEKWSQEVYLTYRQVEVRNARASLYPSIQEQLDMQYWDKVNNTTKWQDTIEAIKVANPIPTE